MEVLSENREIDWINKIDFTAFIPQTTTNSLSLPYHSARTTTNTSSCLSPLARKTVTKNTIQRLESEKIQERDATERKKRKKKKNASTTSGMLRESEEKRRRRALAPEDVRRRKARKKTRQRRRKNLSTAKGDVSERSGEGSGGGFLHWWAAATGLGGISSGSTKKTPDLAEKFSFSDSLLFEITNKDDRKKMGKVGQLIYLKREHHELLGTQFQKDDSGRLWILVAFFKGSVPFSFREQDAIRAACGNGFSNIEVLVTVLENEAETEVCGDACMTMVTVKMVKEEAITNDALTYEPL